MHNTRTLIREYPSSNPNAGQEIYLAIYNIWKKIINLSNENVIVIYADPWGKLREIPLSKTDEKIYWTKTLL